MRSLLIRAAGRMAPARTFVSLLAISGLVLLAGSCDQYLPTEVSELEPPSLTALQLSPDSVNLSGNGAEVLVSLGARSPDEVDSATVSIVGPGGTGSLGCGSTQPASGDRVDGTWRCSVNLSAGSAPGLWAISELTIHHGSDGTLRFERADLEVAGYTIGVVVYSDSSSLPVIDFILIEPESAMLGSVGDTLTFQARAFDSGEIQIPGTVFEWTSSDTLIATVDANGLATAAGYGTTEIRAEAGGIRTAARLTVHAAPVVKINQPLGGSVHEVESTVEFAGSAHTLSGNGTAPDSLPLPDSMMVWTSDRAGQIGTGTSFSRDDLTIGEHLITLVATDSLGLSSTDSIRIRVTEPAVTGPAFIVIEPDRVGLAAAGDTAHISVRAFDNDEREIPDPGFTWSVSEPTVATIAQAGGAWVVTAHSPGVTTMQVDAGDASTEFLVVVGVPTVEISTPTGGESEYGDQITLQGTATSPSGYTMSGSELVWTSDIDGEIGTGTSYSTTTLSAGIHQITLTATDNLGLSAADGIELFVAPLELDEIVITPQPVCLAQPGARAQLQARAFDGSTELEIPNATFTWMGSDPSIATISSGGLVEAQGLGVAEVAAFTNTGVGMTRVIVGRGPDEAGWQDMWGIRPDQAILRNPGDTVHLALEAYILGAPRSEQLSRSGAGRTFETGGGAGGIDDGAIAYPIRGVPPVCWYSEDPSIVTIDQNGVVTAQAEGVARVRATSGTSTQFAEIKVGEYFDVSFILIEPYDLEFSELGQSAQLEARAYDSDERLIEGVPFNWSSSDTQVATVDQNGYVTSTGYGMATITAEYEGISSGLFVNVVEPVMPTVWKEVVSNGGTSCGLTEEGVAYCWGHNLYGKVGDGMTTALTVIMPTRVAGNHTFKAIAIGSYHVLALTNDGKLYAWGSNESGQLGDGTRINRRTPVPIAPALTFSRISAANQFSLALTEAGKAYAWGHNTRGQLGNGSLDSQDVPLPVNTNLTFREISAGWDFGLALTSDGDLWGWGNNYTGRLGAGTAQSNVFTPIQALGGHKFTMISAGNSHSLALGEYGDVYAWGFNVYGQLGLDDAENRFEPTLVPGLSNITSISAGQDFSFAVESSGLAYGWGEGKWGKLGNGLESNQLAPVRAAEGLNIIYVSAGGTNSMALTREGEIWGWGANDRGQIGDGTDIQRLYPSRTLDPIY